jgi:hypothetical protein
MLIDADIGVASGLTLEEPVTIATFPLTELGAIS